MDVQQDKIDQLCIAMYHLQGISRLLQEIGAGRDGDEDLQAMYAVLAKDLDGIVDAMRDVVSGPE